MILCSTNRPQMYAVQQNAAKFLATTVIKLRTPKAAAKHELLCNKPAHDTGLLNKSSCLAPALGVTKFMSINAMRLVTRWSIQ
jgi:hypothetical protein